MTDIETLDRKILLKRQYIFLLQEEISELDEQRRELMVSELRARIAEREKRGKA